MRTAALMAFAALPAAAAAQEIPCVGAAFDRPLPGAVNAVQRFRDVPTARYPGLWQEGRIAGFVYQLSSDLTAIVAPGFDLADWRLVVLCNAAAGSCEQRPAGPVPPAAKPVADMLGRCLLGEDVTGTELASDDPQAPIGLPPGAGVTDAGRILDSSAGLATAAGARVEEGGAASGTCAADAVAAGGTEVQTLQRLLLFAGYDPGPADGMMGARTRRALQQALGADAAQMAPAEAAAALRGSLCGE
ncbi:peptidoglycan-binding protein [Mangrovicoccus sp. HB161399]|uniref:peptidoglycan-binding domain-containing protein n=1 Tax=Mangrovicoccus sp. HB161399 TaxID=2720392 RepID=UPI00155386EE|nr:peptidoglycan-binding domain-containing protein [Mangrovicoccus sp. HB161399]